MKYEHQSMFQRSFVLCLAAFAVVVGLMVVCSSQRALAQTQSATGDCPYWVDAATGKQVPTGPDGWSSPIGQNEFISKNGHTYVPKSDSTWIDAGTGANVPTGPDGWSSPIGQSEFISKNG